MKNTDQEIGIFAGGKDSYSKFKELYDPIIKEYHGINFTDSAEKIEEIEEIEDFDDVLESEELDYVKSVR